MKKNIGKRASLLHFSSLSIAEGMKSGSFKSLYRGLGIEFSGVREYLFGDDVRAIDWNVSARFHKPFVKVFEEERELEIFIVADSSLSMNAFGGNSSRVQTAMECASLLTLASLYNASPVGAVIFGGKVNFFCAPKPGKNHAFFLLSKFDSAEENIGAEISGTALDEALTGAAKLLKKRSLVFVISDFRAAEWEEPFARLCQKNDVVALRISDSADEKIPAVGSVRFSDPESETSMVLPTSGQKFARLWREENERRNEKWFKECVRRGGIPLVVDTKQDPAAVLVNFFSGRERRNFQVLS